MGVKPSLRRSYAGAGFDEVMGRTRVALADQGFGVLTEIDVRETLAQKLGASLEPYVILGACNPPLAHRALEATREIGLLLPCNVVVRQDPDDASVTVVEAVDPGLMAELATAPGLVEVALEARERLEAVLALLDGELA
jgi:uncharacterized protein (DUF302 family)